MDTTGVTLGSRGREDLFDYVTIAEERGLDSIWVGESYGAAAVPLLTRLLERTDSIDVCSGILNVYARTPALVAMTANSLATLDDGRFRLGLGTSGPAVIEDFHGVDFERPLRRTREYVEVVRAFQSGERVDYDGDLFDLSGFALDADRTYETPIYLAAMGEGNRELAGALADGWIPLMVPNTALDDALGAVRAGADRHGRSLADVDVAPWVPTCVSDQDPEAAREAVRSLIGFYIGAMGNYYANAATAFGFGDEADAIRAGWRENHQTGADAAVTDEMIDAFGVAGSPAEAAASAERFVDAGADNPIAYVPAKWADDSLVRETVTHL